jgi:hypothetical protein
MSLEEVACLITYKIFDERLPHKESLDLIKKALLDERRSQEKKAAQQVHQAAPDLAALQKEIAVLMSKVTRFGDESQKIQGILVRQREANREDRYDLYRCIKALQSIDHPVAKATLGKIRPSVIKQMKTFKEV